jgi:myo-inositol-1-phosphate synthase
MGRHRVGLWLVGAFGGVGTTITLGLSAMSRGLTDRTALVTELPMFGGLALAEPGDFVVGGHEIRETTFRESAEELRSTSGVFSADWIAACGTDLDAASARVRPGTSVGGGAAVARMANWGDVEPRPVREAVDRAAADMAAFVEAESIGHMIVLNVASTEPPFAIGAAHRHWDALNAAMADGGSALLPASSIYAAAAIRSGYSYINFTPSLGASVPALHELAESTGSIYAGKDGKTGETLMKTVLAPMFAHRNLKVMSWVGHNIFGNRDGLILDDPANKSSKVQTKDRVVYEILGYRKTAWDHIHFQGFLGTKMTLQFTWQGCDSLLAAPLAIDLARLVDLEKRRGGRGLLRHLASFFKSPEGVEENDFFRQFEMLESHVAGLNQ